MVPKRTTTSLRRSRFGKLLFPEEEEEASTHQQLTKQGHPEPRIGHCTSSKGRVRRHRAGPDVIRGKRPRTDGGNGTKHLRADQGEQHVHAGQGLQEDDTEPETLDGIQHAQPEPETPRGQSSAEIASRDPGKEVTDARDTPPDLYEARRSKSARKHGQEPAVGLEIAADDEQEARPDEPVEDDTENNDLPGLGVVGRPKDCGLELAYQFDTMWQGKLDLQPQLRPYGALRKKFCRMTATKFQRTILRRNTDL